MKIKQAILFAVLTVLAVSSFASVQLKIVGGTLVGASGVQVRSKSYDVSFIDGTCDTVYGFCPLYTPHGYAFDQDSEGADLASQALLDSVFIDSGAGTFDTNVFRVAGCDPAFSYCQVLTQWDTRSAPFGFTGLLYFSSAYNSVDASQDAVYPLITSGLFSSVTQIPYAVWAVWTEKDSTIPEPSTLSLMTLSLLGVLFQSRRRLITRESR